MKTHWIIIILVLMGVLIGGFAILIKSANRIGSVENIAFRPYFGETIDGRPYFTFRAAFDGIEHRIRIPINSVRVSERTDGSDVVTISGRFKHHSKTAEWLEAVILVPPAEVERWRAMLDFYNPAIPIPFTPDPHPR